MSLKNHGSKFHDHILQEQKKKSSSHSVKKIHFPLVGRGKQYAIISRGIQTIVPNYHLGAPCDLGRGSLSLPSSWRPSPELPKWKFPSNWRHFTPAIAQSQARLCQNSTRKKKTIPYLLLFYRQSSIPNMTLLPKSMWNTPLLRCNFLGSQKLPPPYSRRFSPLTLS